MSQPQTHQARCHPDEWQLRVDLAACYRLVALYGWSDLVFTHISAKLPASVCGEEHHFLINPYGLMFDEITASSLVKIDMAVQQARCREPLSGKPCRLCHSQRRARSAPRRRVCTAHAHPRRYSRERAKTRRAAHQPAKHLCACIAWPTTTTRALPFATMKKRGLQKDLGDANFLMLRNHGLLTVGKTIADAFLGMYTFENTCRIQIDALAGQSGARRSHGGQP